MFHAGHASAIALSQRCSATLSRATNTHHESLDLDYVLVRVGVAGGCGIPWVRRTDSMTPVASAPETQPGGTFPNANIDPHTEAGRRARRHRRAARRRDDGGATVTPPSDSLTIAAGSSGSTSAVVGVPACREGRHRNRDRHHRQHGVGDAPAKAQAASLVSAVTGAIADVQFAVDDFKDFNCPLVAADLVRQPMSISTAGSRHTRRTERNKTT